MLRVAYLRVSTASGEQMSALVAQRSRLEGEAPDLMLEDVESGRNPGRPQYQQLRRLIEAGKVREVVAASFSRLGRDATESDAFVALCDRCQVVCRTLDDGVLSMATPEDLLLTRLRGSLSQGESMRLSARVQAGFIEGRKMGKPMRRPCWGYRLAEGRQRLEPDPVTFPRAQRLVETLRGCGWRQKEALRVFAEPVPFRACTSLRAWLLNPVIRGGIGYHKRKDQTFGFVLWDQHPAVLSHAEFEEWRVIADGNRRMWGHNASVMPRILTGLCRCAECGFRLKYISGRSIPSLKCQGVGCSQHSRGTREEVIVLYALEAIARDAAAALAATVMRREPPEAGELRRQIEALERLGDPELAGVIEGKRQRLEGVLRQPGVDPLLVQKVADPRWHLFATAEEVRAILRHLVVEIVVTRQEPTAIRLRL
jgi:DNA invertase Pin-like site-specific DNA recombinase